MKLGDVLQSPHDLNTKGISLGYNIRGGYTRIIDLRCLLNLNGFHPGSIWRIL